MTPDRNEFQVPSRDRHVAPLSSSSITDDADRTTMSEVGAPPNWRNALRRRSGSQQPVVRRFRDRDPSPQRSGAHPPSSTRSSPGDSRSVSVPRGTRLEGPLIRRFNGHHSGGGGKDFPSGEPQPPLASTGSSSEQTLPVTATGSTNSPSSATKRWSVTRSEPRPSHETEGSGHDVDAHHHPNALAGELRRTNNNAANSVVSHCSVRDRIARFGGNSAPPPTQSNNHHNDRSTTPLSQRPPVGSRFRGKGGTPPSPRGGDPWPQVSTQNDDDDGAPSPGDDDRRGLLRGGRSDRRYGVDPPSSRHRREEGEGVSKDNDDDDDENDVPFAPSPSHTPPSSLAAAAADAADEFVRRSTATANSAPNNATTTDSFSDRKSVFRGANTGGGGARFLTANNDRGGRPPTRRSDEPNNNNNVVDVGGVARHIQQTKQHLRRTASSIRADIAARVCDTKGVEGMMEDKLRRMESRLHDQVDSRMQELETQVEARMNDIHGLLLNLLETRSSATSRGGGGSEGPTSASGGGGGRGRPPQQQRYEPQRRNHVPPQTPLRQPSMKGRGYYQ